MAQPTLSFPRATFAKLSPHPFLLANLQPTSAAGTAAAPTRTNGRTADQARAPHVNTSSLSHAHGSAVVRTGDTTVVCGVRGEILPVARIPNYRPSQAPAPPSGGSADTTEAAGAGNDDELRAYDLVVPNIELATGCCAPPPVLLPGGPPTPLAQTLTTRLYSLLLPQHGGNGLLDPADFRIWHVPPPLRADADDAEMTADEDGDEGDDGDTRQPRIVAYWTLYIDLLVLSLDGNALDAAWAAVLAALRTTRLPRARWDADREMVVCSSAREQQAGLTLRGLPVACTAAVFLEKPDGGRSSSSKTWLLLDPDQLEERLCDETVTMVVDRSSQETRVRSISKSGGVVVDLDLMQRFVQLAEERWEAFRKVIP